MGLLFGAGLNRLLVSVTGISRLKFWTFFTLPIFFIEISYWH